MAYDQEVGTANIRTQYIDGAVKGFATAAYKFKQAVTIDSTSAWKNYFYRETSTALTGKGYGSRTSRIKGISRGAEFPQASVSWEKVMTIIEKYGLEENITWEDLISDDIDVRDRTLMRVAEGVAKAVDDEIWSALTEATGGVPAGAPTSIQTINIYSAGAEARFWDVSSAAIIDDLLQAKQKIAEYNYDTTGLMAFVSPKDYRSIMSYLADKGAQFPTIGAEVASNGQQGKLAGIQLIVSNSVTASYALVVLPKRCGTWKSIVPLSTTTKEDPYKSLTIRSVEMGVTQVTDPKAVVLIQGTQNPN